jgi:hypothetical protein
MLRRAILPPSSGPLLYTTQCCACVVSERKSKNTWSFHISIVLPFSRRHIVKRQAYCTEYESRTLFHMLQTSTFILQHGEGKNVPSKSGNNQFESPQGTCFLFLFYRLHMTGTKFRYHRALETVLHYQYQNGKLKLSLCLTKYHAMKTYPVLNQAPHHEHLLERESIAPRLPTLGTRREKVVRFTPRPLYHRENSPWKPLDRRLSGPRGRSGPCGENRTQIVQPTAYSQY